MIQRPDQANQAKRNKTKLDTTQLTFLEHLYELRKRLFWVVLTLVFTSAIGLQIKDPLIEVVMAPLHGEKLIYLTPGGGFSFIFTLCLYFGALFTIPVIVFQIYRFLRPMIGEITQRFVLSFMIVSTLLAAAGASFGYFFAIPAAIGFLSNIAGEAVVASLTAESYLNFVVGYMFGLALLFQLPLLLFLLDHVRPLPPGALMKSQRFVIVAAIVLAALITPTPDMLNLAMVAGPVILVYEIGVIAVYARRKKLMNLRQTRRKQRLTKIQSAVRVGVDVEEDEPLSEIIKEFRHEKGNGQEAARTSESPLDEVVISMVETKQESPSETRTVSVMHDTSQVAQAITVSQTRPKDTRVAERYKTNVRVPSRGHHHPTVPQRDSGQPVQLRTVDGFLTVS